jgi:hypothetical protein
MKSCLSPKIAALLHFSKFLNVNSLHLICVLVLGLFGSKPKKGLTMLRKRLGGQGEGPYFYRARQEAYSPCRFLAKLLLTFKTGSHTSYLGFTGTFLDAILFQNFLFII